MSDEEKEQLQQEVVRRYENLSDELKRAMMSVSSAEIIYEVGRKHDLNVEKIGILAEEIGYIMLGMVPPSGFISDLKELLEVEENKANEIAQEINHKIFLPIREEIKRTYGTSFSEEMRASDQLPTTNSQQPTTTRPMPPAPSRVEEPTIPPRPTPPFIPSQPIPPPFNQRPTPPPIPPRPTAEGDVGPQPPYSFGQGPAPFQTRPTPPPIPTQQGLGPIPPRPTTEGGLGRPTPPPIFSQPKEITRAGEIKQPATPPSLKALEGAAPPPPELPTKKQEIGSGKLEVGLPEVEEELKPKLLESLPKEKPLEARIAEKNPPKYHLDPYKEPIE